MKNIFKFKLATKIGVGFAILTLALILNALLINNVLNKSERINKSIITVYQPSEQMLIQLRDMIVNSQMLIKNWVFVDKVPGTPDKQKLVYLHNTAFPEIKRSLARITDQWDPADKRDFELLCKSIDDTLFMKHRQVMDLLNRMSNYDDPSIMFMIVPMVSDNGEIVIQTDKTLESLRYLIQKQRSNVESARVEMDKSFSNLKKSILLTCLALIAVALITAFITVRSLTVSIDFIKNILLSMSKGILPSEKIRERDDEIGEMSKALNQLVTGLHELSGFALEIGRGNYNSDFKPLSENDVLGNSLLRMRDDLKFAAIEEAKRKLEDEQRNWATTGIAKFSDILRHDNDKLDSLSYNVVSNLVDYLDANQGGIFFINSSQSVSYVEMIACYAYNRRKYLQKRLETGEGLVGRCIAERETIYLTELPDNYIKINSGLGEANPRSLVLVPLKMNDDVLGVIEIASFNEMQAYQIEFVEKISEIVAATLSTVKTNMQTAKLLEQSKIQTEELAAQEEEMRQNIEELRATQEEAQRKELQLQRTLDDLSHSHTANGEE